MGTVNFLGQVKGTIQNPDLSGTARFVDASISKRGLSSSLTMLNGDAFFSGNRVTLNNLVGKVGGGTVQIQGAAVIREGQLDAMDIRIETDGVRLRYPEGLRTVLGGSLTLRGSWAAPILEARNLEIQSMSYRSTFDEFLALFQAGRLPELPADAPSGFERLGLALHLEGSRNITIKNELADVEARVDLDIKGTVANPAITGHVEASGGTFSFQGIRYQVTRGNIDFIDPLRIEPNLDIQAETDIRNYRVVLRVTGRASHPILDYSSDPPLPKLEIISLITGGKTREELLESMNQRASTSSESPGRVPTSEQLFQSGAASVLFDMLKTRVGNRFGVLGLDRVRIDPALVGPDNNPAARITVPLQVTKDLAITYSYDLSKNTEEIVQIEYFVSKNVSILASHDETGALALDVRLRKRF